MNEARVTISRRQAIGPRRFNIEISEVEFYQSGQPMPEDACSTGTLIIAVAAAIAALEETLGAGGCRKDRVKDFVDRAFKATLEIPRDAQI